MQKIKGTKDWFGLDSRLLLKIQHVFSRIANNFNFSYVEFPILENVSLFKRSSGEESDIVSKEMYTFKSKSENEIALRPEGTAPFIRMFLENKLEFVDKINKYWYVGPMFRYEQPQKGRYRQFTQLGIENICLQNVISDSEAIIMAKQFLQDLKINDYRLLINNIGTIIERQKYVEELKKYLLKFKDKLEPESIKRLSKNVLRILDDKKEQQKDFIKKCPKIIDFLSVESIDYFNKIQQILNKNNINFEIDYNLVRGLDYYENIVFEFVSTSKALGSQSAIIAGGRYNLSIKENQNIQAIGWAAGVERIVEILIFNKIDNIQELTNLVVVINKGELEEAFTIANKLRKNQKTELITKPLKISKVFKLCQSLNPKYLVIKQKEDDRFVWVKKDQATGEITKLELLP